MPTSVEIVGPFKHRELVVNGYTVPCVQAVEGTRGVVHFTVDHRIGYSVSAADVEQVARLIADVYAIGLGLSCAPEAGSVNEEGHREDLRRVPILMRPRRMHGIASVDTEEAELPDDPRNDE